VLSFGPEIPFVHELGFTLHKMEDGESELHFTPRPEHLNSFGVTHGGASMTLMDVTMAVAARSVDFDLGVVTIEMKTSFMQAANGPLVGKGVLLHRTAPWLLPKAASTMHRADSAYMPRAPSST
jgi:uncharacterized protein (TIGR00369 family)